VAEFPPPLTVGLFGTDPDFLRLLGSAIGKTGTESDLRFWNKRDRDLSLTAIAPSTYPEKVVPMLQVAALCDYPVLVARELDAPFGEMVIALSATAKKGLLILRDPGSADRARALVKERLHGWVHLEWAGEESIRLFRELLPGVLVPRDANAPCTVVLDHAFSVRGVGTVTLGFVKRGTLRVHDELRLAPLDGTVLVRSIQRFDEDHTEAPPGSRVGVAIKGVEADEIERGFVLTADDGILSRPVVTLNPYHNVEFSKDPVETGARGYHLAAGAFVRPVVLNEVGSALEVTADRPMPLIARDIAFLTVLRGPGSLRVLGSGPVVP
jgi:selenocysteine-specific translation elongation factor